MPEYEPKTKVIPFPESVKTNSESNNDTTNKTPKLNDFEIFRKTYSDRHEGDEASEKSSDSFYDWIKSNISEDEYKQFVEYDKMLNQSIMEQKNSLSYASNEDDIKLHQEIIADQTNALNEKRANLMAYIAEKNGSGLAA